MPDATEKANAIIWSLAGFVLLGGICYGVWQWMSPKYDVRRIANHTDSTIKSTLENQNTKNAVEFFEAGGKHIGHNDPAADPLDQEFVLPLLKQIEKRFGVEARIAVPDGPTEFGRPIYVELPKEYSEQQRLYEFMKIQDERFDGAIMRQFGYDYLMLDFVSPKHAKNMPGGNSWDAQPLPPRR